MLTRRNAYWISYAVMLLVPAAITLLYLLDRTGPRWFWMPNTDPLSAFAIRLAIYMPLSWMAVIWLRDGLINRYLPEEREGE